MTTTTLFLLLAEFGTGHIPLEKCCHHFGMKPEEANRRAARQSLPVPVFRLGSQKSPWLVAADALAGYIDEQRDEATKQWQKLQRAS
ncbi:pyocin activator PrtN family protein [Stenotrophomonas sp. NLF4-10]|uniref:pyocin activator PrtN family protein n=1 Tax=Stenotrophomonas sp. NLF4-10 TaxID=2918754 RepID=UPI001EFB325E|nr:pyocin activator PrtN family protein [Stenotrophomonas sp. NLF4-10]MCG8275362.1 pyocin activator PrtN family protein [Stenotrophomonas sp. NLF4-10]